MQSGAGAGACCARIAVRDFARNAVDAYDGITANSRDCVRATRVVRGTGCPCTQDRFCAWPAVSAVPADKLARRNTIGADLDFTVRNSFRMRNIF
jgi:hypothetical protein